MKSKIDFSKVGSVKNLMQGRDGFNMNMNLTDNQLKLLNEEAVYRLNESPKKEGEMLHDFLKRVCAARLAHIYLDNEIKCCQSFTVSELFKNDILSIEDITNPPNWEDGDEIYEWWIVSPWLADKLEEHKYTVLQGLDCVYWGRQCTGQSIILDRVLQNIAIEFVDDDDIKQLYDEYKSKKPFEKQK